MNDAQLIEALDGPAGGARLLGFRVPWVSLEQIPLKRYVQVD